MPTVADMVREEQDKFNYTSPKWVEELDNQLGAMRRRIEKVEQKFPINRYTRGITLERHIHDLSRHPGGAGATTYDYIIDDSYSGSAGASSASITGQVTKFYATIDGALADAVSVGGSKSFLILAGTYTEIVARSPASGDHWDIYGIGSGVVNWQANGASQTLLHLGTAANSKIRIRYISFHLGSAATCRGIDADNLYLDIRDCDFNTGTSATSSIGIRASGASLPHLGIYRCRFTGVGTGYQPTNPNGHFVNIDECHFSCGIGMTISGSGFNITNSIFACTTRDIDGDPANDVSITNCQFYRGTRWGNSSNLTVVGSNFTLGSGEVGIDCRQATSNTNGYTIVGNSFDGTSTAIGVALDAQMLSGVVSNNTFDGFTAGQEITGTGGTSLDVFHNISDAGVLVDHGAPVGHSSTAVAAPSSARYFTLGLSVDLTNELSISEADASTIDAGVDLKFIWAEANRRDFQIENLTALGASTYMQRSSVGDSGTPTASNATTVTDTAKTWVVNYWAGATLIIGGRWRRVTSNTATILTVPTLGTSTDAGTATSTATTTMTDSTKSWVVNQWAGGTLVIGGQTKTITSNTATVITITTAFSPDPPTPLTYTLSVVGPGTSTYTLAHDQVLEGWIGAEANPRATLLRDRIQFGPGSTAADMAMIRTSVSTFRFQRLLVNAAPTLDGFGSSDFQPRWRISTGLSLGAGGTSALDTILARASAGQWNVTSFFKFPAIATPTLTGATTGDAALYSKLLGGAGRLYYQDDQLREIGPLGLLIGVFGQLSYPMGSFQVNNVGGVGGAAGTVSDGILATPSFTAASQTTLAASSIGWLEMDTGTVSGTDAGIEWPLHLTIVSNLLVYGFRISAATSIRVFIGWTDQTLSTMNASDNPAGNYVGLQYSSSRDTNWQWVTKDGTTQTLVSTGVAAANTELIVKLSADPGTGLINASLLSIVWNATAAPLAALSATLPTPGTSMRLASGIRNTAAASKTFRSSFAYEVVSP